MTLCEKFKNKTFFWMIAFLNCILMLVIRELYLFIIRKMIFLIALMAHHHHLQCSKVWQACERIRVEYFNLVLSNVSCSVGWFRFWVFFFFWFPIHKFSQASKRYRLGFQNYKLWFGKQKGNGGIEIERKGESREDI